MPANLVADLIADLVGKFKPLLFIATAIWLLNGCTVLAVTSAVVGTTVGIGSAVVGTTVDVAKAGVSVVTGSSDSED